MIADKQPLRPGILLLLCLFNCALLLHLGNLDWYYFKTSLIMLVMVALQFENYKRWWPTAVSIIACCTVFLLRIPRLANHFNTELITGIIILGFLAYRYAGFKNRITPVTITRTMRYVLIALYFIAGFHKLNSGFFNIDNSCANYINLFLFGKDVTFPSGVTRLFQIVTIVTEMVLPFGLLHYKLRKPTACLLVLFHIYLSLCGFSNFSSFAAFMLAGSVINLNEPDQASLKKPLKIYLACCIITALIGLVYSQLPSPRTAKILEGLAFSTGFIILFRALLFKKHIARHTYPFSIVPVISVALLLLWGIQPYIGLSTARSFNMYSNLITEKSRNNHLIIDTRKTKIWDYEEDYVTVVKLPKGAAWRQGLAPEQCDIPLIEFRRMAKIWARKKGNADCTIIYKGKRVYIPNLKESEFSKTKWWHRFIFYRIIPKEKVNPCLW